MEMKLLRKRKRKCFSELDSPRIHFPTPSTITKIDIYKNTKHSTSEIPSYFY